MKKRILSIALSFATVALTVLSASATTTSGSQVYFDNSAYNWDKVYVYAYGTEENAAWPGQLMTEDDSGLYTMTFPSTYESENIIFTNGLENGEGKEQYPEAAGLPLAVGQCKLLTADLQWIDYGKMDDHGYGFSYVASGTSFTTDSIDVKLGLKNANLGYYSIDGSQKTKFTDGTVISVGEGKISDSTVTLVLTAKGDDGVETEQTYTFNKRFIASTTTISASSDGHTTDAETGYYSTNPNLQLGKYKTITVDGDVSDWDSSMIIAQGVANDDPRVYMPSSLHEQPWDAYALYCAWDDNNLYFMWEMANVTYIVSPSDTASNEAPYINSIPMYLALSINPSKQATGKAIGTNKDGSTYTNPFVWGCDDGVAKDGGVGFETHIDTLIAMDTNNSNVGASIFKADTQDTDGTYMFNYDTRIPIGVTSGENQDNQNGFMFKYANTTKSQSIIGINAPKGSRVLGDNTDPCSNWVDFRDLGYKDSYGYVYEVGIPLSLLGIDKDYIETNGIGVMQILTYGTSGMDTLPHDPSVLDAANVEYSSDPSTSHEKEDVDTITVPLARVGSLLSDTVVNYAPFEVNFGADKSSGQVAGTPITISATSYNNKGDVTYNFSVNGTSIQNSSAASVVWTPSEVGTYQISINAVDSAGNIYQETKSFTVIEAVEITEQYTITFDTNGGSSISDKTNVGWTDKVLDGITAPTRSGYSFNGWKCGDTTVTENTTYGDLAGDKTLESIMLTAQWKNSKIPVITGLENGKTYCDAVEFEVSDNDGVASVTAGGTELTSDTNGKYTLTKGLGTVTVVATDNTGNTAEVTVTVNNGHTYGEWVSNSNGTHTRTCTVDGCTTGTQTENCTDSDKDHKCDYCGIKISEHTGGTATCKDKAKCEICGEAYGEVDSSNHNLEKISAKDATVTETGNTEYWHCKDCGKYFADKNGENEINLDDTVISKLPPKIIEGKGQSVTEGEKKSLTFRSNAAFGDFIRVELDGKTLDKKNYTATEGSTVVNLKADYVATLSAGEHTIGIISESGTASTTFTVNAKAVIDNDTKSPQTDDTSNLALWIALLFISGGVCMALTVKSKKLYQHGGNEK